MFREDMSMLGTSGQAERREGGQDRILTNRHVTIMPGRGGEVVMASTANLGPGGMFITSDAPFAVGDRFICKIDLGDKYKPVLSGGEVRWVDGTRRDDVVGAGIKFLDIAEAAQTLGGELPARGPENVRVRLESVGSALAAEVVERSEEELVLDVELPFLQPGAQLEVGHDLSARTAEIRQIEWSTEDAEDGIKVRLWLDLEPSAVHVAADRVVRDARDRLRARRTERSSPAPEPVRAAPVVTPKAAPVEASPEPETAEPPVEEPETSAPAEAAIAEERRDEPADASAEPEAELVPDRPAKDAVVAEPSSEATADGKKPAKLSYDDLNLNTLFPFWGGLESVLGRERCMRLVAIIAAAYASVKARLAPESRRALAAAARDRAARGWTWTKERLGPAFARLGPAVSRVGAALKISKLTQRTRRQPKGEPSRVVRALADRARKVAAGRGKTIAVAFLVALSLAGLATAGFGLAGSESAQRDREQLQSEAASSGWSADRWQEPEPANADTPNPS
jgi:hypothetical protein